MVQKKWIFSVLILAVLLYGCASNKNLPSESTSEPADINYQKAAALNAQLAIVYTQRGMLDRAKEKLLKAKTQDDDIAEVYYAEGLYYQHLGMNNIAERAYQKALAIAPEDFQACNFYARFLCDVTHQYNKAEKLYQKSVLLPDNANLAETFTLYGQCLLVQHQVKAAKGMFFRAISQGISSTYAYWELARIEAQEGHNQAALNMVNEYIKRVGETKENMTFKMHILQKLGRENEAVILRLRLNSGQMNRSTGY